MFNPGETRKSLAIEIIYHEGYAQEKDFYLLLKNPVGKTELGEPNLARITIIDDDGNESEASSDELLSGPEIKKMWRLHFSEQK